MFHSIQGTTASKVQLTTAHGQLYCSLMVSPTLFQTDLRITNHRGYKFPPSLTLLSVPNSNRMASMVTATARFPRVFFQLLQYSKQQPSFSAHRTAMMIKTDLTYPAFPLRLVDFPIQSVCFCCKFLFHEKRRLSQV